MTCGCVITFTQGHLGKVNVTSTKKEKFVFGLYLFYVETLEVPFSPKIAYDLKFDMTLTQGQLAGSGSLFLKLLNSSLYVS